jgi:Holliday junction resolvase RusA-like endonuclease
MPPTEPLRLTLPWPPLLNHYYRTPRGMSHPILSAEGRAYKNSAGYHAYAAGITEPLTDNVALSLALYRPQKRGDIDGPLKAILDSMQGHLYADDSQITELHVYRSDDKTNPRVEVLAWTPDDLEDSGEQ